LSVAAVFANYCHVARGGGHIRIAFGESGYDTRSMRSAVVLPLDQALSMAEIIQRLAAGSLQHEDAPAEDPGVEPADDEA
jgi:hypothetical protein